MAPVARDLSTMQRAYGLVELKSFDETKRTFTGIATTVSADRYGDIVESKGAQFKLPITFLYQHDSRKPIGWITAATVGKNGIEVAGHIENLPDAPDALKERLDVAWAEMKAGLIRGLSIGFRPLEYAYIKDSGGVHFTAWEWMELSLVSIPANAEATLTSIKSFDSKQRAAHGRSAAGVVRLNPPPGATGTANKPAPAGFFSTRDKGNDMKTIAEQIRAFEEKRAATVAAREAVQQKAVEEGRSKTAEEREQFKAFSDEIDAIDEELRDLRIMEKQAVATAAPVQRTVDTDPPIVDANSRGPVITDMRSRLEPGQEFGRWALAMALAKGSVSEANSIVQSRWKDSRLAQVSKMAASIGTADFTQHFGVQKTAIAAGDSTTSGWASQLAYAQNIESEFIEYLRPKTVIGRVGALVPFRRVPFNFRTGSMTGGTTAYWVGQGSPVPVSKPTTSSDTLGITKLAGMTVVTDELLRLSSPSVEMLVRDDLAEAIVYLGDTSFLDPNQGGTSTVQPASITYGITANQASGTDYAAIKTDVKAAFSGAITANQGIANAVWVMSETTALALSLMQNSLGQQQFPGMTPTGGQFLGAPVVTSQAAYITGSPDYGNMIVLLFPREIFLADDGSASVEISNQASVQMLDNPTNASTSGTTATSMVSMFQTNSIAIKALRYINWKARGTRTAVGLIRTTAYN